MEITFDPDKDVANIKKHGVSLRDANRFEWETALRWPDTRRRYGEARMAGIGYIGRRLFFLAYVERVDSCRVISLRKANDREVRRYAET